MLLFQVLLLIALPACLAQFTIQGPSDGNRVAQGLRIEEGKGIEYTDQNGKKKQITDTDTVPHERKNIVIYSSISLTDTNLRSDLSFNVVTLKLYRTTFSIQFKYMEAYCLSNKLFYDKKIFIQFILCIYISNLFEKIFLKIIIKYRMNCLLSILILI